MGVSNTANGWWYGADSWSTATNTNNFTIKMPSFTFVLDMPKHPDEVIKFTEECVPATPSKFLSWDFSWK